MSDSSDIRVSVSAASSNTEAFKAPWRVASGKFLNLPSIVCSRVWSPIIWQDNKRSKANFLEATVIALDFDDGKTIQEAVAEFGHLDCIIGTTKSHQIAKTSSSGVVIPACDRFRVILRGSPCSNRDNYEHTLRVLAGTAASDKSCTDGARLFYPCVEIVHKSQGGLVQWLECPEQETDEAKAAKWDNIQASEMFHIPAHCEHAAIHGVRSPGRHKAVYIIACEMYKRWFTQEQI